MAATRNARARGFGIDGWKEPISERSAGFACRTGVSGRRESVIASAAKQSRVHIATGLLRCARNDERGQRSTDVTPAPEPGFGFFFGGSRRELDPGSARGDGVGEN
jgi:hypothetical protein